MSKGIFVIPEIPPYCSRCPFEVCGGNSYYCDLHESITVSLKPMPLTNRQEKPDWCPIKPMPERWEVCGRYPQPGKPVPSYRFGWNACLDEIEGKAN